MSCVPEQPQQSAGLRQSSDKRKADLVGFDSSVQF